ncbi:hypothetical protein ACOMA7_06485 [Apilactobacillus sp. 1-1-2]|uniref:hypothetical protein n=1 Tax=Apilactobacillus sp. 1-1-2 TaxID=3411035 RepID=UPI003B951BA9
MKNDSTNHNKLFNCLMKLIYSSILMGALYSGWQYLGIVQAQASENNQNGVDSKTTDNDSWDGPVISSSDGGEIYFDPDYAYYYPGAENFDTPYNGKYIISDPDDPNSYAGVYDKGTIVNTSFASQYLKDKGFETYNIPSTVTMNDKGIHIQMKSVDHKDGLAQFKLIDFNGNYIKSYYDTPSSTYNIDNLINKIKNDGYNVVYRPSSSIIDTTNKNQVYDLIVQLPYHVLSINTVDSTNNKIITKYLYAVTNYGTTSTDYVKDRLDDEYSIANPNDLLKNVPNNETNYDIVVNRTSNFNPNNESFYGDENVRDIPDIDNVSSAEGNDDSYNPAENEFHTKVNFVDKNGKLLDSAIFSNQKSNLIYTRFTHLFTADKYMDDNVIPTVLDLDKGPYTFTVSDEYLASHGDTFIHDDNIDNEWREGGSKKLQYENQKALDDDSSSNLPSNNVSSSKNDNTSSTSTPSNSNQQQAQNNSQQTEPQTTKSDVNSSQTAQSNQQSAAEPAKSSTQPAPTPAPVVQSHATAAPVTSTEKATPAPAQAPKQTQSPAPQPAVKTTSQSAKPVVKAKADSSKPTKAQLKAITKTYKKSEHVVKTDTSKLKALKKKMKKHATKKQKATYKKLQTKLAAEKKAFNSVKTQEGKLFKYFKSVATIGRDNKQIKSLTAQMKKLKKKHSKASKNKYSKDKKALKKANNSLKAATKFVKNYK